MGLKKKFFYFIFFLQPRVELAILGLPRWLNLVIPNSCHRVLEDWWSWAGWRVSVGVSVRYQTRYFLKLLRFSPQRKQIWQMSYPNRNKRQLYVWCGFSSFGAWNKSKLPKRNVSWRKVGRDKRGWCEEVKV